MTKSLILAATFLSAFLLFLVQPMFAKYLLPYFGGTSSVWTISIFFYSTTLLLGYLYSALLTSWSSVSSRRIHSILLFLAGVLLVGRWMIDGSALLVETVQFGVPAVSVLLTLLFAVGLPVLLLASTSVLAQHLYAKLTNREPYALFALSNAGSLIGLAAYPFVLESATTLSTQVWWWMIGFIAFMSLFLVAWRRVESKNYGSTVVETVRNKVLQHRFQIVFLAAIPTFMLASCTEFLSKGIASFPLLWVIPLMLYLISFIVAFGDRRSIFKLVPFSFWVLLSSLPVVGMLPIMDSNALYYWFGFWLMVISFFLVCVYFHRQVYHLRPRVSDLGPFYVWLTFGGAIGSGVVGLLLPLILSRQVEIYWLFTLLLVYLARSSFKWMQIKVSKVLTKIMQVVVVLFAVISLVTLYEDEKYELITSERNFYGTVKVYESLYEIDGEDIIVRSMANGATTHGFQVVDDRYSEEPVSYYTENSGIDVALRSFVESDVSPRVGVVGLGAGVMSVFCRDLAQLDYLEINPTVERLAREHFSYLEMCPEKTTVAIGDGRLLLEEEAEGRETRYEVIVIDAFTDDAIPSHLLTNEAFVKAYQPLLTEDGVMAIHISNRYLDLRPPIAGIARNNGYEMLTVENRPESSDSTKLPTSWVLIVPPEKVDLYLVYKNVKEYNDEVILWTDQKNSVMSVLSVTGSMKVNQ